MEELRAKETGILVQELMIPQTDSQRISLRTTRLEPVPKSQKTIPPERSFLALAPTVLSALAPHRLLAGASAQASGTKERTLERQALDSTRFL